MQCLFEVSQANEWQAVGRGLCFAAKRLQQGKELFTYYRKNLPMKIAQNTATALCTLPRFIYAKNFAKPHGITIFATKTAFYANALQDKVGHIA